ncbi:MAG TPA: serine/threonine-protein kinase [Planctomycetaceae bacterium]|nr:serine/threonine-protein kinase [Planctomycetaceae bacterium]
MAASEPLGDPVEPSADLNNVRIGEFLLLRRLGSGGMADVYLAEQTSLHRNVAVKVLKNDAITGGTDVLLKRFEQEARAAGGLSHPNLVQIITTGRENDISYIVQEYVAGLNLSQWIKRHGTPDYGTGLKWMQQIAAALHAAWEAGIVHRDVKPENVMVTRNGVAKVTDFGLAQLNQPSSPKMNLTQIGTTMGTPWYMSPEQIQGEKLDHRSDQYSMGVTCYHMFAGQPPFPGKNAVTVAVQHLKEEPVPLSTFRGDLPKDLCAVIHRMMQKKPADRFQSHEELEAELKRLDSVPINTRLGSPNSLFGQWTPWLPDARRIALGFFAVLVVSFVAGRRMERPVRLPEPPQAAQIERQPSAVAQFAIAMLQPTRASAWRAVISNFPNSQEADLARLRLGVAFMAGAVPDSKQALDEFQKAADIGALAPEKSHLKLLGLVGQLWVLERHPRTDEADTIMREIQLIVDDYGDSDELESVLDKGPQELKWFFERSQLGITSTSVMQFNVPPSQPAEPGGPRPYFRTPD